MRTILTGAVLMAALSAGSASAGIVTLTGNISQIPTPSALNYTDMIEFTSTPSLDRPDVVIFAERVGFAVPDFHGINPLIPAGLSLQYQISAPGTYGPAPLTDTPLAIGTNVTTYIVHYDFGPSHAQNSGSIVFDRPIFAIQTRFSPDWGIEGIFSPPNINVGASSGLEINDSYEPVRDTLTLSADRMTLAFDFRSEGATEVMRIIFVPEPSTIGLFATALALAGIWMRRTRHRNPSTELLIA